MASFESTIPTVLESWIRHWISVDYKRFKRSILSELKLMIYVHVWGRNELSKKMVKSKDIFIIRKLDSGRILEGRHIFRIPSWMYLFTHNKYYCL